MKKTLTLNCIRLFIARLYKYSNVNTGKNSLVYNMSNFVGNGNAFGCLIRKNFIMHHVDYKMTKVLF